MVQITTFCDPKAVQAVLQKMEARAPQMSPRHPYYGLTQAQLQPELWKFIEQQLVEHCSKAQTDPLLKYAFIVGAPLDDTVFMCTGAELEPNAPQHTFSVQYAPIGGIVFMIDFYTLFDGRP